MEIDEPAVEHAGETRQELDLLPLSHRPSPPAGMPGGEAEVVEPAGIGAGGG